MKWSKEIREKLYNTKHKDKQKDNITRAEVVGYTIEGYLKVNSEKKQTYTIKNPQKHVEEGITTGDTVVIRTKEGGAEITKLIEKGGSKKHRYEDLVNLLNLGSDTLVYTKPEGAQEYASGIDAEGMREAVAKVSSLKRAVIGGSDD